MRLLPPSYAPLDWPGSSSRLLQSHVGHWSVSEGKAEAESRFGSKPSQGPKRTPAPYPQLSPPNKHRILGENRKQSHSPNSPVGEHEHRQSGNCREGSERQRLHRVTWQCLSKRRVLGLLSSMPEASPKQMQTRKAHPAQAKAVQPASQPPPAPYKPYSV